MHICVCVCVSLGESRGSFYAWWSVENRQRGRVSNKGYVRGAWRHFLHLLPCMLPNDNAARGIDTPRTAVCHPVPTTLMYPNVGGYVAWRPIPARSFFPLSLRPSMQRTRFGNDKLHSSCDDNCSDSCRAILVQRIFIPASCAGSYTVRFFFFFFMFMFTFV